MMIKSGEITLREIDRNDIQDIHALHSYPEVDQFNTLGIPESIEETESLVLDWMKHLSSITREKYVLVIENSSGFAGLIGINIGSGKNESAEIWYKLLPSCWNKGYASTAVLAVLNFIFNDLKLHRVEAGCATENTGSQKVLLKAGFTKEGHHRKILPIRGMWVDNYSYAILEEDFFRNNHP